MYTWTVEYLAETYHPHALQETTKKLDTSHGLPTVPQPRMATESQGDKNDMHITLTSAHGKEKGILT